ncbi:hypothetical protein H5410_046017 [Solanum commersonii]|uniref:Uncharacterized protein n=1 Tax=Solanum commersonii TaxID=4109 RepID=A0A9J5XDA4_SOLCO|nr:hypothetical protein H5410_046017 [Solanum commersonii]
MEHSLSQRRTQCMLSPIDLPVFSNRHLLQLTQDQKGLFKACKRAECKGVPSFSTPRLCLQNLEEKLEKLKQKHIRTISDRLTKPEGESLNFLG